MMNLTVYRYGGDPGIQCIDVAVILVYGGGHGSVGMTMNMTLYICMVVIQVYGGDHDNVV